MNFGRIRGRSKNLHKNYFIHCAMRITRTKSSCLSLRWPSVNFSLRKRKCIQEILPFENSRIYTFEKSHESLGKFSQSIFSVQQRNRAREPRELAKLDGKTERGKANHPPI